MHNNYSYALFDNSDAIPVSKIPTKNALPVSNNNSKVMHHRPVITQKW